MTLEESIDLISNTLSGLITGDYVYIDIPGHHNVGDHLIALGAFELLKKIPYRCIYKSSGTNFREQMIPKNAIILLQGGGNFGDLYPGANIFRNHIVQHFPNNRIIFLPQTITYIDHDLIIKDSNICAQHNDLHICARDDHSMEILSKYFYSNHLYKLPDTAIGLRLSVNCKISHPVNNVLLIKRKDNEINDKSHLNCEDTKDWDDILKESNYGPIFFVARCLNSIRKRTGWTSICQLSNFYLVKVQEPFIYHKVCNYFMRYNKIITTRLHGYLLACILGIPAEWIDTKYGKISSYCNTWGI